MKVTFTIKVNPKKRGKKDITTTMYMVGYREYDLPEDVVLAFLSQVSIESANLWAKIERRRCEATTGQEGDV